MCHYIWFSCYEALMFYFMRQKNKQRRSEVRGQYSLAERLNKPLIHPFLHSFIHPDCYRPLLPPDCMGPILSLSPRGLTATEGVWLSGVTGENVAEVRALSCVFSCDYNSEKHKDTNWKRRRGGGLIVWGQNPEEKLYRVVSLRYRNVLFSFQSHLL